MIVFHKVYDLNMIKTKVVDHTIKEVRSTSLLYNTLREDGQNVCIPKMRHMPSLTKTP